MSNWSYSTYESQATNTLRLAMLRDHIAEVSDAITATVGADGKSRDANVLVSYRKQLDDRRKELESMPDTQSSVNGGQSLVKIHRPRGGSF